eukprot:g73069.t1
MWPDWMENTSFRDTIPGALQFSHSTGTIDLRHGYADDSVGPFYNVGCFSMFIQVAFPVYSYYSPGSLLKIRNMGEKLGSLDPIGP